MADTSDFRHQRHFNWGSGAMILAVSITIAGIVWKGSTTLSQVQAEDQQQNQKLEYVQGQLNDHEEDLKAIEKIVIEQVKQGQNIEQLRQQIKNMRSEQRSQFEDLIRALERNTDLRNIPNPARD